MFSSLPSNGKNHNDYHDLHDMMIEAELQTATTMSGNCIIIAEHLFF